MLALRSFIQLLTIIFSLAGAYLIADITYTAIRREGRNLIRARIFLNESFLQDSWKLLFLVCFIFLVNAVIEFNDISGLFLSDSNLELLQEMTALGILVCSITFIYKWYKLISPAKNMQFKNQSYRKKSN